MIFYPMKRLGILRVGAMDEAIGIDVYHHGETLESTAFNPNITKFTSADAPHHESFVPDDGGGETPVTLRMDSVGNMHWTPRVQGATPAPALRAGPLPSAILPAGNAPAHSTIISMDSHGPSSTTSSVELHAQMFGTRSAAQFVEMASAHKF